MNKKILLIGHRGANKEAPENTLKSFEKAIELGADYIEFDIHLSKDKEIIIMHDENTFRTTGYPGVISEMTLSEIKKLDCGEGEKIPTLRELIELAKNKIKLQCEIKAEGSVSYLINLLKEYDLLETTIISSFKHEALINVRDIAPDVKLAALEPSGSGWVKDWFYKQGIVNNAVKNNFDAIHPLYNLVDKDLIKYAHKQNLLINAWTVDSKRKMEQLIEMGIDGIITNDIKKAKKVLGR